MADIDPLDGLERHTLPIQVAVLANEMRNQSRRVGGVERAVRSVQVALWALVVALITTSITLLAAYHH